MLSRRALLQRAGAATAAFALPIPASALAAAVAPALSPQRQATYAALIEALAFLPASPADPAQASTEAALLATRYSAGTPGLRLDVDDALDSMQSGLAPGAFARMSARQRLTRVRDLLRDDGEPRRMAGALRAVGFALAPFCVGDPRSDWTSLGLVQALTR